MRYPEAAPYTEWLKMHTSTSQGLQEAGVIVHVPSVLDIETLTGYGSYTTDEGIGTITTASALQVYEGCSIWLGTAQADGKIVWKVRTRARETSNSTTTKVAAFGQNDYGSELNRVKSIDEYLPHIKRPRYKAADNTWYYDFDVAYNNDGGAGMKPQVIMGGSRVGNAVTVDATRSVAWASGATISSYAWEMNHASIAPTGTGYITNTDMNSNLTLYGQGVQVKCTVTDSAGNTNWGIRTIYAANSADAVLNANPKYYYFHRAMWKIQCTEITSEFGGGCRAKFTATMQTGDTDRDASAALSHEFFPDGTAIVVYGKLSHQGTRVYRPNNVYNQHPQEYDIFFDGYIVADSLTQNDGTGTLTFEAASADALLDNEVQLVMNFYDSNAPYTGVVPPSDNFRITDMTVNRAVWHYLSRFTTLPNVRDVDIGQFVDVPMNSTNINAFFDFGSGTAMDHLKYMLGLTLSTISFDVNGSAWIEQPIEYGTDAKSLNYDLPLDLANCHNDFKIDKSFIQPVAQVYIDGNNYGTPTSGKAPNAPAGYGKQIVEQKGAMGTDAQLQAIAKRKYQKDSLRNSAGITSVNLELGNMPFDVVPQSMVALRTTFNTGAAYDYNPSGLLRGLFVLENEQVTPQYGKSGTYYFLLQPSFGTLGDPDPIFDYGELILHRPNPYYNTPQIAAIGKVGRASSAVYIAGNNCGSDTFNPVNPPHQAPSSWDEYFLTVYTGGIAGSNIVLDDANTIKNILTSMYFGAVGSGSLFAGKSITATYDALTYRYMSGNVHEDIATHYWSSTPGHKVEDYILFAGIPFPQQPDNIAIYGLSMDDYIYAAPRSLTWTIDSERGDMRCKYTLEPMRFKAAGGLP